KGFQAVGRAADTTAKGLTQLAGNDGLGVVTTAADAVADTLEQIPIAGQVYAAEIRAATAVVRAYTQTVDAFVKRGQELRGCSGALAGANAQAEVARMRADIREADRTGESLARLTTAQSRLETLLRDLLLPIKQAVTERLAGITEKLTAIAGAGSEQIEKLG